MRPARNDISLVQGYHAARTEAEKAFGNSGVYIEKLIENIRNDQIGSGEQRRQLNLLQELNRRHADQRSSDAALETRIHSFELA